MKYLCQFALVLTALHQVKGSLSTTDLPQTTNGNCTHSYCDLDVSTLTILDTVSCGTSVKGGMDGVGVQYYEFHFNGAYYEPQFNDVLFDACDSNYDNYIWFYDNNGTYIDHEDDACGLQSRLLITGLDQGNYIVGVGACCSITSSSNGNFTLNVTCTNTSEPTSTYPYYTSSYSSNNSSNNSYCVYGPYFNIAESIECGESVTIQGQTNNSLVWYKFNVSNANMTLSTCDSNVATTMHFIDEDGCYMANYNGDDCGSNEIFVVPSSFTSERYAVAIVYYNSSVGSPQVTLSYACEGDTTSSTTSTTEAPVNGAEQYAYFVAAVFVFLVTIFV